MHFSFLFLVIVKCSILSVYAKYNKDVVCVVDKDQYPVCTPVAAPSRRNSLTSDEPSQDPYIPRSHSVFYNCTLAACEPVKLISLIQVTNPYLNLKSCFQHSPSKFDCEPLRYNYLKNVDKLLFLKANIQNKTFYLVDCLVYADNSRVCHSREGSDDQAALVDVGALVRPGEQNILSQEEFLCEESDTKEINCDIDPYVPFSDGLKLKQAVKIEGDILLKTGSFAIMLSKNCIDSWCGYSGRMVPTRRTWFERYDPPGGKVFRCYYAKRQQVCRLLYDQHRQAYNERGFLET